MKRDIIILLGIIIMASTVHAKNNEYSPIRTKIIHNNYNYNRTVNFIESGITFSIFTNGDFDYESRFNNRNLRINRDLRGRIRNIGNVQIKYNINGNVTKIGNVFIRYRRGLISNVGNLRVRYDKWRNPVFYGNVNNYHFNNDIRINLSIGEICNYNDSYFYGNSFRRNYTHYREDNNFIYYKAKPNARIGKRSTILKRRKNVTINNNRKKTINNSNRNKKRVLKRKSEKTYLRSN